MKRFLTIVALLALAACASAGRNPDDPLRGKQDIRFLSLTNDTVSVVVYQRTRQEDAFELMPLEDEERTYRMRRSGTGSTRIYFSVASGYAVHLTRPVELRQGQLLVLIVSEPLDESTTRVVGER